jgi:hypothetical protein
MSLQEHRTLTRSKSVDTGSSEGRIVKMEATISSEATLETKEASSSESSVAIYQTTQRYISKTVTFTVITAEVFSMSDCTSIRPQNPSLKLCLLCGI